MSERTKWLVIVLWASASFVSCPVLADEALLLIPKSGRYFLTKGDTAGLHEIASLGGRTLYGHSRNVVGLLSGQSADASTFAAYEIDTTRALGSWHVPGQPASQLMGPSRDVVVNERFAYFVTIRYVGDEPRTGPEVTPFDFHELSLADGSIRTIPLPRECANPRLFNVNGVPLLYSFGGAQIWKYDAADRTFVQILSNNDLDESSTITSTEIPQQTGAPRFANYALVADGGAFRLSPQGTVMQILKSDFSSPGDRIPLKVPPGGNVIRLYSANLKQGAVLGVLQDGAGEMLFSVFDVAGNKLRWTAKLAGKIVPDSVVIAPDASIYYVDVGRLAILKTAAGGVKTSEVWNLQPAGSTVNGHATRIISVKPSSQQ